MPQELIEGFRLSPQQKHLWLLQQIDHSLSYRVQCAVSIEGILDTKVLEAALVHVVNRHEILRTTFQRLPGMTLPIQVIAGRSNPLVHSHNLCDQDAQAQALALEMLFHEIGRFPFDLERGPLLYLSLVTLSPDRHMLLVSLPALCADTATLKNLVHEISHSYSTCLHYDEVADEPVQYADISATFNELLESEDAEIGREYWHKLDTYTLLTLKLPFENEVLGRPGFEIQSLTITMHPDVAAKIEVLVEKYDTSAAVFLLACWQLLLWRLSGQANMLVGSACDGRTYEELAEAFGLYAKYVPIHCHLEKNLQFREILKQLHATVRDGYEWQETFAWEQSENSIDNAMKQPFFSFCFDFEEEPPIYTVSDISFSMHKWYACVDRFKIKLACVQRNNALIANFYYDPAFFSIEDIQRLGKRLQRLLESVTSDPEAAISTLDILGDVERQQLLVAFNNTQTDYPQERCVHQLFEEQVAHTPDNVAVVFENQHLTYAALNARANQLAHHLCELGVGAEALVAICVERSLELAVGLLGVLKAGGAYVPLDLTYPQERLAFMLADTQVRVLLTTTDHRPPTTDQRPTTNDQRLTTISDERSTYGYDISYPNDEQRRPAMTSDDQPTTTDQRPTTIDLRPQSTIHNPQSKIVNLDADWPIIARQPAENPSSAVTSGNLAYVIYTSGSTGRPKGVMIPHRGLVNYLRWCVKAYRVAEGRGAPVHSPIGFDLTVTSLFAPLVAGQPVVLLSADQGMGALSAALRTGGDFSFVKLTPAHLEAISRLTPAAESMGRTRALIVGGEALQAEQLSFWRTYAPGTRIINEYGPTETVVGCCAYEVPAETVLSGPVPIGRPIANTQIYLLDDHLCPAPIGVPGELYIGGAGVARGYLHRPDLTAERFIPNPFAQGMGDGGWGMEDSIPIPHPPSPIPRLYKTGDLARYRADGAIEFLGRIDQQVKIRGFRVELGEIESLLGEHPGVQDAVVLAREEATPASGYPDKRLVAYLVPDQRHAFTPRQLVRFEREGLLGRRQSYELPSAMVIIHHNKNETDYLYKEIFEEQAYMRHGVTLEEGACVFDVGANIGMFTLYVGQTCKNAVIYAFEPIPPIFDVLRMNTALYGLNAKLFKCGLSRTRTSDTFSYYPHLSLMSGRFADLSEDREVVRFFEINQRAAGTSEVASWHEELFDELLAERLTIERVTCEVTTLSDVIREHGVEWIDLLKIDVEKSEEDVLAGIQEGDWAKIRQIVIEVYDKDGRLERIMALLKSQGYHVAVQHDALLKDTGLYNIYAVRRSLRHELADATGDEPACATRPIWNSPNTLVGDVRSFLQDHLPDYMIPSAFVLLDELPLTPNGKVDRRALPVSTPLGPEMERVHLAPHTLVEELLVGIWAQVLHVEALNVHDNFFALGGHSLLAIQVGARIRESFQVELPLRHLFETPTVAGLAKRIELAQLAGLGLQVPRLMRISRNGNLPLSFAQQRLWFLDQFVPGNPFYNIPAAVRFRGQLDVTMLHQSLNQIVRRHEALRTTFVAVDGQPFQVIAPALNIPLPVVDLRELPEHEREAAAPRLAQEEARQPFDLACGPLLRATLLRLDKEAHVLLLSMHHIVADGWSIGVLIREATALYDAFRAGKPSPLPEISIQYADFATWQRTWLQGEVLADQLGYWKQQLAGAPIILELPTDRPRPAVQSFQGATQAFRLPRALSLALMRLSQWEGGTLFMTLLTAFQTLLYRYTGQDDILVGSPIAGRTQVEVEGLIGFFVNTLVLRADLSGAPSFREALQRVRNVTLAAYAHQDLPFEHLVEDLQPERDLSRHPLFQVQFILQNAPMPALELPGLTLQPLDVGGGTAKFDLTLSMTDSAPGLRGALEYNTDLFDAATIGRMSGHLQTILDGIVADPDQRLVDLPLLTGAERQQLLVEWNTTATRYPQDACVHQRIEAQMDQRPDAIAVVFDGRTTNDERPPTITHHPSPITHHPSPITQHPTPNTQHPSPITHHPSPITHHLTYAELNCRANQLAHHLRRMGVGPEVLVALCLERSLDLVIALLGVLKAGGAYVPLDPTYPKERLAFMLTDTRAPVLLTQERLVEHLPQPTTDHRPPTTDHRPKIEDGRSKIEDRRTPTFHPRSSILDPRSSIPNPQSQIPNPHSPIPVYLDADWPSIAAAPPSNPACPATPDNLAYVIYTSGSTGAPKGVLVPHQGLVNYLDWCTHAYPLTEGRGAPVHSSLGFDLTITSLFTPLVAGQCVTLLPEDGDITTLSTTLRMDSAFSLVKLTPTHLALLGQVLPATEAAGRMRALIIGGEALTGEHLEFWQTHARDCRLINEYGPTETVVGCCAYEVPAGAVIRGAVPIGRPIANTQVYVLDAQLQPVPIGVVGELHIGGVGLARGYHRRPDLTAERFLPNPFAQGMGDGGWGMEDSFPIPHPPSPIPRLYKTGDLARYRSDGNIDYLGRSDQQVKLRGYRIELGEVEAALLQHSAVHECAVVAREDREGDTRLVAYVVPKIEDRGLKIEDSRSDAPDPLSSIFYPLSSELRAFLKQRLPEYMLPALVALGALPLTANGKVDRKALLGLEGAQPMQELGYLAPRSAAEALLVGIWAEVLGLARVGVNDNFFALGGHSLLVTQVMSRVRATFQVDLPLRSLFEAPTVAGLAERIMAARHATAGLLLPPLRPILREEAPPLSFAQQRLWFLDQLEPNSSAYNVPAALRLSGSLDIAALQQSLNMIVERHEALRTTFATVEGRPVQVIAARQALPLLLLDLQALSARECAPVVPRLASAEAQRPFDLTCGPLVRATLVRLAVQEHVVLLIMHHIVSDGWSMGVLVREVMALYTASATGQPAALPALPIQYADYASWQRTWLREAVLEQHLAYWRQRLADLPALKLPTARPRSPARVFQGASFDFVLPTALNEELVALSQREGVTLFMTLLATWQVLLARYSGQDDIVVGTDIANRNQAEIEDLIGFFVNQLVLRTDVSGNPTFRTLLEQVRDMSLDAYAHQDLPFEQLVGELQPERDLNHAPLFGVKIILQNTPMQPVAAPDLTVRPLAVDHHSGQFDLVLSVRETAQGIAGTLEYSTDLFDAVTMTRMSGHFQMLLTGVVADCTQHVADLPLLTEGERQQLLVDWNATQIEFRSQESEFRRDSVDAWCIHHLFEAQVARTPDAVAVVFDGRGDKETRRQGDKETRPAPSGNEGRQGVRSQESGVRSQESGVRISGAQSPIPNPQSPVPNPQSPVPTLIPHPSPPPALRLSPIPQHMTYHELNARANQLAHHLQQVGVGPEVRVGLYLERSLELVVGLLGVLKAGGAYVALTPGAPPARLAFMLEESGMPLLLTQARLAGELPVSWALVVCLDANWTDIARQSAENPVSGVSTDHLAYLIYTSGSTGTPKGVLVSHRGIGNLASAQVRAFDVRPDSRVLQFAAFSFDAAVSEVWMALVAGATLVLGPQDTLLLGPSLIELLKENGITTVTLPPSALAVLPASDLSALRTLVVAGEACSAAIAARWAGHWRFINAYGPTEATVCAMIGEHQDTGDAPSLGRPIANTQVYVLDAQLQPVPIGVVGELHIGGVGLARGYHRRPDLTAERFLPNPFAQGMGDGGWGMEDSFPIPHPPSPIPRLYKTGDLARYRSDGNIDYLGRSDQQVKLRGYRIELGEVEALLAAHPAVQQAVVVVREDVPGEKRLVAYLVLRTEVQGLSGAESSVLSPQSSVLSELRAFLKQRLPHYMLPAAFVALGALPLTPNGKVDRKALLALEGAQPLRELGYLAPHNAAEALLAGIWSKVFGLARVGVQDNFFALGGDSILSLQIVAKAHQAGLHLTPRQLFEHQTIADLAALAGLPPAISAQQGLLEGAVPLTPIQHWFFAQNLPDPQHYNQALLLIALEPLAPHLLARALQRLLLHHDALRLRFVPTPSGWRQHYLAVLPSPLLTLFDLSQLPLAAQPPVIETVASTLHASLHLSAGPLVRVALFDCGAAQPARLLLIVHHLLVDGVSWRILLDDLQTLYRQLVQRQPLALAPKSSSFQRWAEQLAAYAQSETARQELTGWLELSHPAPAPLPRDLAGGANTVASTRTFSVALDAAATLALLREVPAVYHTQISEVLLTALVQAWSEWSGEAALLLELEGHGREELVAELDLTRTVGWFTTLFPLRLALAPNTPPGRALQAVKAQVRAVPKRGLGYGVLRYLSQDAAVRAAMQGLPSAEVSFNYLGQVDQVLGAGALLALAREGSGVPQSQAGLRSHVLAINGLVVGGRLELVWSYSAQIHHHTTIERLAQCYLAALRGLIAHCQAPEAGGYSPADFPLAQLDQAALDRLLGADRYVEDVYPLGPTQQGILFHTVDAPGVYFAQMHCVLQGSLDRAAFERAWQSVVDRHSILRSAFVWAGLATPLQIVRRQVRVPWTQQDWRALESGAQTARLASFLAADRAQGFALAQAPLLRLALFQLSATTYQFVWSHHHLLLDGWSLPLILKEVFACYAAFALGHPLLLAPPRPYRDYIAWLQHQDLARAEAFWRQTLQNFTTPTSFGVDRPSGQDSSVPEHYAEEQLQLATPSTAALQALAQQHGLTLNTLVQGAWALLLNRYSGRDDVVFGATVAGRPPTLLGVEQMVGLFINTLPVRVRIAPGAQLLDWLTQLQAQQVEARQYEYTPLVQVQGWSDVPRGQPLFESIMVFENYPVDAALRERISNLAIEDVRVIEQTNYPLTLVVVPGPALTLRISYGGHRFDAATIVRMLGHLRTVLEGIAADSMRRLAALPLLSDAEWQELVVTRNTTQGDYPTEMCFHQLFEAQVARTPDACAVVFADAHLTYRELNRRANRLAHYLCARGVRPTIRVGICVERSFELVIGLLGIFKAGSAFVPLDPTFPTQHMAFILADAQIPVLLTQARLRDRLPNQGARIVSLDADWPAVAEVPSTDPQSGVTSAHLAYLIYTSGSTGRPKGVPIPHRSLVNYLVWCVEAYGVAHGRGAPVQSSIAADAIFPSLFAPLLVGTSVVLIPETEALEALGTALHIAGRFSMIKITPSQLEVLNYLLPWTEVHGWVRTLVVGAEALHGEVLTLWQTYAPATILLNEYGPTETVVGCSIYCVPVGRSIAGAVPIGLPIANTQFYVLDARMQPVAIGVPGELYIGGDGVAWGYHNRPDLTAAQFVPNPFARGMGDGGWGMGDASPSPIPHPPSPGTRLYKTGDLVRYLPDRAGNIEFVGRIDDQVKIRGYRVEPGEVEAVLGQHAAVRACVVLAREDVPGARRLVAYVVTTNDQPLDAARGRRPTINDQRPTTNDEGPPTGPQSSVLSPQSLVGELRSFLHTRLPAYMVPAAFVLLAALPLAPHGKIDRHALPAPDNARPALDEAYAAPRSPAEAALAEIWAEVLGVAQVGLHDNFFALGGDSILSLQIIAKARQKGQNLTPRQLFQYPTIAALAAVAGAAPTVVAEQELVEGPVPLTPIQHWFFSQDLPSRHHYNQALLLLTRRPLNPLLLEQALQHLLRHHDALRLRFVSAPMGWQQLNAGVDARPVCLHVDLTALPRAAQTAALEATATALQASLDLADGPLVRVARFDYGTDRPSRLLLIIHHLAIDGVSWRILLEDLQTAYEQLSRGETVTLPPKTTSFQQWATRLVAYADTDAPRRELDYWLAERRITAGRLPVDQIGGANTMASARGVTVALDMDETDALLHEVPAVYDTQINDVLLTALAQALADWSGADALLIDLEGHGREDLFNDLDLSRTVGWFTTLFPVLLDLEGMDESGAALKAVKEQLRQIPHHGIGYGVLRYLSRDTAVVAHLQALPQAEVSFNYLGQTDQALSEARLFSMAQETSGLGRSPRGARSHLLEINGMIVGGQLRLEWTYSAQIHHHTTIERLAQAHLAALRALIAHCQSPTAGGYMSSDFAAYQWSQEELDAITAAISTSLKRA